jgi:Na+/proline symporter
MHPQAENSQRSHLFGSRKFRLPIFSRLKKIDRSQLFIVAIGLFTALIFSQNMSTASAASAPSCANYVGLGGTPGPTTNQAGHGCVIIIATSCIFHLSIGCL